MSARYFVFMWQTRAGDWEIAFFLGHEHKYCLCASNRTIFFSRHGNSATRYVSPSLTRDNNTRMATNALAEICAAADFAARKHRDQRRKDPEATPYINHPIGVAYNATHIGCITDRVTIAACLLHDTVEDTDTTYDELVETFGKTIADVVMEVTDDRTLSRAERKRAQIEHVSYMSDRAKLVKLCDKLYNLQDFINNPPAGYTLQRIQGYIVCSRMALEGARGLNAPLEAELDKIFNGTFVFEGKEYACCPDDLDEAHVFPTH